MEAYGGHFYLRLQTYDMSLFNTILLQIITSNGVGLQVLSTWVTALPLQYNYSSQHGNSNNIEDILQDTVNRHRYVNK